MFSIRGFIRFVWLAIGGLLLIATVAPVQGSEVTVGANVIMSVTADGTPPFSYQWQKNGSNVTGATAAKFLLSNVQSPDAGDYAVVVSNSMGSVTSPTAALTVQTIANVVPAGTNQSTPTVVTLLSSQIATSGHDVTFTAAGAVGGGQWQGSSDGGLTWNNLTNDGRYTGATTTTLVITNVTAALNGYKYRFVASGISSNAVLLSVASAFFAFPVGIAADGFGNLYVGDTSSATIQKISPSGSVTLLAGANGQTGIADGTGTNARFNNPVGLSSAYDGTLSVCDNANGTLRHITPDGTVSTLAGSTTNRGNADGNGSVATFSSPLGISQDGSGNLYVADALNNTIRKITPSGVVSTLAGSAGLSGVSDALGSGARFNHPTGIAVDGSGTIYVADAMNNTVRKITPSGAVTTLAGLAGVSGFQDGIGGGALFNNPGGLAVDSSGNVYLADTGNSTVRKIAPNGAVSTLAGLPGIAGLMDGVGGNAWFNQPKGLVLDSTGNLFVADTGNAAIRKVTLTGVVSTVALSAGVSVSNTPGASTGNSNETSTSTVGASSQSASSGGSGGGGAMTDWFMAALILAGILRWRLTRFRTAGFDCGT